MSELKNKVNALKSFHNDEDGMETMQVVIIIAIAAIVLVALLAFWGKIKDFVKETWTDLTGKKGEGEGW
jgi:Flp pilus assembly pilin Flp